MKPKQVIKIFIDFVMTVALMLLMTYELVGAANHEWIGTIMFVLFLTHHILNVNWGKNLFHGKYTLFRFCQTVLVVLVLLCMIGSMVSGVILSRHVFRFLSVRGGKSWARTLHMLCAYWGYVLMSLHLGIHWNMMMGMAKRFVKKPSEVRKWILRVIAVLIAGYGVYAFIKRDIGNYMFLKSSFVFFDFSEHLYLFLFDYTAIMGLFVFIGHYISAGTKKVGRLKAGSNK